MSDQQELANLRFAYEAMKLAREQERDLRLYAERRITEWQEHCAKLTDELAELKGTVAK